MKNTLHALPLSRNPDEKSAAVGDRSHSHADIFSRAVEQSPTAIVITDEAGKVEYVNDKFTDITGYAPEEIVGQKTSRLKSGTLSTDFYADLWNSLIAGQTWRGEFHNRKKNGQTYWENASIAPIRDRQGVIRHYLKIAEDITRRKQLESDLRASYKLLEKQAAALRTANGKLEHTAQALRDSEQKMRRIAVQDTLTGLLNRRGFEPEFRRTLALTDRQQGQMGLLVIDIDYFKRINDRFGHAVGDRALTTCARLLKKNLRRSDIICRYGGDEFIVALPMADDAETLTTTERLLQAVRAHPFDVDGERLSLTVSIGAACSKSGQKVRLSSLMRLADHALYRSKDAGRNRVTLAHWTES